RCARPPRPRARRASRRAAPPRYAPVEARPSPETISGRCDERCGNNGLALRYSLGFALAKPLPILEPLLDLALEAALDRSIEAPARQLVGKIIDPGEAFVGVGIVDVVLGVAELLHEPR